MSRSRSPASLSTAIALSLMASGVCGALYFQKPPERHGLPTVRPGKGTFLVAAPHVAEPFSRSAIVLLAHGDSGTVGVIINRATRVALSEVLPDLKPAARQAHTLFFGGPVALNSLIFLYRSQNAAKQSDHLMEDVYFGGDRSTLEKLLEGKKLPSEMRLYLGYSGWAPGQLDAEILRGDWHVARADAKTLFREDVDSIWPELIERARRTLVAGKLRL